MLANYHIDTMLSSLYNEQYMNLDPQFFLIVISLIWSLVLTVFFVRFFLYYSRLTKKGKKESLIQILEDVLKKDEALEKEIASMKEMYVKLNKEGELHIQKIGLVRFNPFNDTGGDQSFILAMVDANNTGVVISSLHTRTGTRWYAKKVEQGKGIEYELSDEETKALKSAASLNNTE